MMKKIVLIVLTLALTLSVAFVPANAEAFTLHDAPLYFTKDGTGECTLRVGSATGTILDGRDSIYSISGTTLTLGGDGGDFDWFTNDNCNTVLYVTFDGAKIEVADGKTARLAVSSNVTVPTANVIYSGEGLELGGAGSLFLLESNTGTYAPVKYCTGIEAESLAISDIRLFCGTAASALSRAIRTNGGDITINGASVSAWVADSGIAAGNRDDGILGNISIKDSALMIQNSATSGSGQASIFANGNIYVENSWVINRGGYAAMLVNRGNNIDIVSSTLDSSDYIMMDTANAGTKVLPNNIINVVGSNDESKTTFVTIESSTLLGNSYRHCTTVTGGILTISNSTVSVESTRSADYGLFAREIIFAGNCDVWAKGENRGIFGQISVDFKLTGGKVTGVATSGNAGEAITSGHEYADRGMKLYDNNVITVPEGGTIKDVDANTAKSRMVVFGNGDRAPLEATVSFVAPPENPKTGVGAFGSMAFIIVALSCAFVCVASIYTKKKLRAKAR